mmetsp:Transcript_1346/g.3996  ORF Transcript_1346/g.3996 Transcript_1346/m.3996 type:complete len:187 (-) Transcript_1346:91-651(-)
MSLRTQFEAKTKRLKSDNALEYKGMRPLLRELGIQWDPCAPYTPSGNGIAERMVRTVTERLRATIFGSGLGEDFWPEALPTVVKNLNRTRRKFLKGKTPDEVATGERPQMTNTYPFGARTTFKKAGPGKTGKMEERSKNGILMYIGDCCVARIYDPESNKFIHSRSWRVSENIFPAGEAEGSDETM